MSDELIRRRLCRGEVDGVETFWMQGGGSGQSNVLQAALWFRFGLVDLPLVQHGWAHALEHLVLHGENLVRRPVNGAVSMLHTGFFVEGSPQEVAAFLEVVCQRLADPQFGRLDHELRVLRAESARARRGVLSRHLIWRYGAQGPGLAGFDEFGLHSVTSDALQALARRAYTRGNAALAFSAPPPRGLRLPLSAGGRLPVPTASPCTQPYPAGFTDPLGDYALSGVVERSHAATALSRILARRLETRFRHSLGVGYSAWNAYEAVDAASAVVAAGIDLLAEGRERLAESSWRIVENLARGHVAAREVHDDARIAVQAIVRDPTQTQIAWQAARESVSGRDVMDADAMRVGIQAVTEQDVADAAAAFHKSMLVSTDGRPTDRAQMDWLSGGALMAESATGRSFAPIDRAGFATRLKISDRAVTIRSASVVIGAAFNDVAAELAFGDGGRILVRRDAYQISVEPTLWRRGAEAVALLDHRIPAEQRISLPARDPTDIPHPPPFVRRVKRHLNQLKGLTPVLVMPAGLLVIVLGAIYLPPAAIAPVGATVFLGVIAAVRIRQDRRSRQLRRSK